MILITLYILNLLLYRSLEHNRCGKWHIHEGVVFLLASLFLFLASGGEHLRELFINELLVQCIEDSLVLGRVRSDDGDGECDGNAEAEHAVDEGSHHFQVNEGDIELRECVETLSRQLVVRQLESVLDLCELLQLLLELLRVEIKLSYQKTMSLCLLAVLLCFFSPAHDSNQLESVLVDNVQLPSTSGDNSKVG